MTLLEFWGCTLTAFGPSLALFSLTVAPDPIKVIVLISSSFFWLLSFLSASICWSIISLFCDYLFIGAYLAVLSQELFRYLFYIVTQKAQIYLAKSLEMESSLTKSNDRIPMSYVSGLGFGLMNAAFSLMNILTDHIGPGTVGLKGDSQHFLLVSSLTALAFTLLNIAWSIIMSESVEKSDKRLAGTVILSHLVVTTITFVNSMSLQLVSVAVVYATTVLCGFGALQVAGINLKQLTQPRRSSTVSI